MTQEFNKFWYKMLFIIDNYNDMELTEVDFGTNEFNCFYEALVEWLHNRQEKPIPKWIKRKVLKEPWVVNNFKSLDLRILSLVETPVEFKIRNIYIAENAFSRC